MFRYFRTSLSLASSVLLATACSNNPPPANALGSAVYSQANAGLVLGAIARGGPYGTGISFKHLPTGQLFSWSIKDYYSAWLPAGEYEVESLGSRAGSLGPYDKSLHFTVKQGQLNYVGELGYGCAYKASPAAEYGVRYCGLLGLGSCSVSYPHMPLCVTDRAAVSVRNFIGLHPQYADLPVTTALMKGVPLAQP